MAPKSGRDINAFWLNGAATFGGLQSFGLSSYVAQMIPPWNAHPHIHAGSIGWRMGVGEDYLSEFRHWFARKHAVAKRRYADDNPEPIGWEGFYSRRGVPAS
jgi:hypothetical protein